MLTQWEYNKNAGSQHWVKEFWVCRVETADGLFTS